jgi:hypothetical protein
MKILTAVAFLLSCFMSDTKEDQMKIIIGTKVFRATLLDSPVTLALKKLLPMQVKMIELNGNEKYFYLSTELPTNASKPGKIHAGDIMLFGSNTIVIFYETFLSSYSYTKIGRVDDITGLKGAIGTGNVEVKFEME